MAVDIVDAESDVHVIDSEALLTPQVMSRIVQTVLRAVKEEEKHAGRIRSEQRINAGRDEGSYPA